MRGARSETFAICVFFGRCRFLKIPFKPSCFKHLVDTQNSRSRCVFAMFLDFHGSIYASFTVEPTPFFTEKGQVTYSEPLTLLTSRGISSFKIRPNYAHLLPRSAEEPVQKQDQSFIVDDWCICHAGSFVASLAQHAVHAICLLRWTLSHLAHFWLRWLARCVMMLYKCAIKKNPNCNPTGHHYAT